MYVALQGGQIISAYMRRKAAKQEVIRRAGPVQARKRVSLYVQSAATRLI